MEWSSVHPMKILRRWTWIRARGPRPVINQCLAVLAVLTVSGCSSAKFQSLWSPAYDVGAIRATVGSRERLIECERIGVVSDALIAQVRTGQQGMDRPGSL